MGYKGNAPSDLLVWFAKELDMSECYQVSSQITLAWKYICRIENVNKQKYAKAYLKHILCGDQREGLDPPDRPPGLSYMGAQAIGMALRDILHPIPLSDSD